MGRPGSSTLLLCKALQPFCLQEPRRGLPTRMRRAEMDDVSSVARIVVIGVKTWNAQGPSILRVLRLVVVVVPELELVVFFIIRNLEIALLHFVNIQVDVTLRSLNHGRKCLAPLRIRLVLGLLVVSSM